MVGRTIATKLVELGHEVMLGSRTAENETAAEWVEATGAGASQGTFADAAPFGELLFNCCGGLVSVEAIGSARPEDLAGKTLVDVANPLDLSSASPAVLVDPTDSLGEQIQRAFPEARIVKALNTVDRNVMVHPARVHGEHDVFVCGTTRARRRKSPPCSRASAGRTTASSTSETSPRHAAPRRIWPSG
jgi:predicted dinucleotide-binding enzyme